MRMTKKTLDKFGKFRPSSIQTTLFVFIIIITGLLIHPASLQGKKPKNSDINAFIYHRFGEQTYPSTNIDIKTFKQHLEFLHANEYTVLTLGKALKQLKSKEELPDKTAVLSVDDGYKSFKTVAVPLLDKYNYKATIFLCTQYVGKSNYLSWEDIRELRKKGYEFGNHSHSHDHFLNYSDERTRKVFLRDLSQAEQQFKQHLGYKPDLYCYPYGEYNPDMQDILRENNYRAAAAQKSGVIYAGSDMYALPRFPMTSSYGIAEKFRAKVRMKALPVLKEQPKDPEIKNTNPPSLSLHIDPDHIHTEHMQCFVNGRKNCKIEKNSRDQFIINIEAESKLNTRRTLYTITAPSKSGNEWYWYSHLWVNTDYGE